jgi:hypothetical protein
VAITYHEREAVGVEGQEVRKVAERLVHQRGVDASFFTKAGGVVELSIHAKARRDASGAIVGATVGLRELEDEGLATA